MTNNLKLICESSTNIKPEKEGKKLYIVGQYMECNGKKNQNGRLYPKTLISEQIQKLQSRISSRNLFGQLGHPTDPTGDPSKISHRIDELWWDKKNPKILMGKSLVLDTRAGRDLAAIINAGSSMGISSRGLGDWDRETGLVDSSTYRLLTFDAVTTPGFEQSYVSGVYEGKSWSPCEVSKMFEQDEEPGEERQCICWWCWKTINTFRDCSMERCPVCHKEMNNFPDDNRLDKEPSRIYTCYCQYCQESHRFRNMKCSEVTCPVCKLKLKQEKIEDSQEIFQQQIQEWKSEIREREFG